VNFKQALTQYVSNGAMEGKVVTPSVIGSIDNVRNGYFKLSDFIWIC